MPSVLLLSPEPLAGKTAIAAGLGNLLHLQNQPYALSRLPGDGNAETDAALFAELARSHGQSSGSEQETRLIEASAGDPQQLLSDNPAARALVVASGSVSCPAVIGFCASIGDRLTGLVLNKVPAKRIGALRKELESAGTSPIAVLPEDRLLAAPILGDVALALSAKVEHMSNGTAMRPLDRPVIATISADPGQAHFTRYDASAVIVRSDKPDLQLAAINAGATCLIVTEGLPLLSYVLDRAEEDEIPLLRTSLDTIATVRAIEALFAVKPFPGGEAKLQRMSDLLSEVDLSLLTRSSASR
jgi:BioD-like phosphotransacetylase family protein